MFEPLGDEFMKNPLEWMEAQAKNKSLSQLLAFADDGVIRGQLKSEHLELSSNVPLRAGTLQRAHLFGANGELRISRAGDSFESVWLDDSDERLDETDETYPLWSEEEGNKGMLTVRHFVRYDDQGQAYISHSRLVDVKDA